jgi:hypothetical protein
MPIPASTEGFGTRQFVFLVAKLLAEYLRHEITINPDLSADVKTALTTLLAALPDLLMLNPPGPE